MLKEVAILPIPQGLDQSFAELANATDRPEVAEPLVLGYKSRRP